MTKDNPTFPEIKKELVERIENIEVYIKEGVKTREEILAVLSKIKIKVYGDDDANPPIIGLDDKVKLLETSDKNRKDLEKTAGYIGIAGACSVVGASMIWAVKSLITAFRNG